MAHGAAVSCVDIGDVVCALCGFGLGDTDRRLRVVHKNVFVRVALGKAEAVIVSFCMAGRTRLALAKQRIRRNIVQHGVCASSQQRANLRRLLLLFYDSKGNRAPKVVSVPPFLENGIEKTENILYNGKRRECLK